MTEPLTHEVHLEEAVATALTEAFSPQYSNIRPFREGGTRSVFKAEFGLGDETTTRVIKVDLPIAHGPRAQRYFGRGYTTRHDLRILIELGEEAAQHHLTQVYDFRNLEHHGISSIATVEPYFESQTLEEVVKDKPLTPKEVRVIFGQVLDAAQYLNSKNVLHRDLSAKNILVQREKKGMPTRVTDLANARVKSELHEKALPTAGARSIMDPLIVAEFTGQERAYTEQSEIYALAHNVYYALTGSYIVDFDPDSHRLSSSDGTSLLDDGKIDHDAYEKTLATSLKKLPRRIRTLVRKGLTLDEKERFESLEEFIEEFNDATKPSIVEHAKEHWKQLAAAASVVGTLVGGAAGVYTYQTKQQEQLRAELVQAKKLPVSAEMNGEGFEISSNVVDVDLSLYSGSRGKMVIYPSEPILKVEPGNRIDGSVFGREGVGLRDGLPREYLTFPGKVYIEGYEGKELFVDVREFDEARGYGYEGYNPAGQVDLSIPSDIAPGFHYLAVELYAPTKNGTTAWEKKLNERYDFKQPGKVLVRKRIPLVVGDIPESELVVPRAISLSGFPDYLMTSYLHQIPQTLRYVPKAETHLVVRAPELSYTRLFGVCKHSPRTSQLFDTSPSGGLDLPGTMRDPSSPAILQLISYSGKDERPLGYTFVPVEKKPYNPTATPPTYFWEFSIPGRDFSDQLIERRKDIEKYSHEKNAK